LAVAFHKIYCYVYAPPNLDLYPATVIVLNAIFTTIITASPLILYCLGLVRRLQHIKNDLTIAAEAAKAASQAKSSFLANMSHEIRTPLNGILGMTAILMHKPLPAEEADYIATIHESGKVLAAVVNDILDISKIEAGRMEISLVEVRPRDLFESLRKLFVSNAEEKNLTLSVSVAPAVPLCMLFDVVRVRQCVSNILSNAIKFTDSGGVTVSVTSGPSVDGSQMVSVSVTDTGIGIKPDVIDRLFSDFSQADASTSRRFGGTGLGISIARKLARLMGGDITVKSEERRGSTFILTFAAGLMEAAPVLLQGDADGAGEMQRDTPVDRARVLVVDDNAINRKVIRLLLKPAKMEITEAENGRLALDELTTNDFDLVLLDIQMPVMDGLETIRHIRDTARPWRNIPVIALTADVMNYTRSRLLELGMDGHAIKPIDQRALISEIARVLNQARSQDSSVPDLCARRH
jgi:signal transduction histidine kinase/CheY-like chemotaxis protein